MYQIKVNKRAEKDLKKLSTVYKQKAVRSLNLLASNPLLGDKMSGEFLGSYRIKIPPIRIIYQADHQNKIIQVRAIGHRQGVYNRR